LMTVNFIICPAAFLLESIISSCNCLSLSFAGALVSRPYASLDSERNWVSVGAPARWGCVLLWLAMSIPYLASSLSSFLPMYFDVLLPVPTDPVIAPNVALKPCCNRIGKAVSYWSCQQSSKKRQTSFASGGIGCGGGLSGFWKATIVVAINKSKMT